jgi:hypothetical protein
LAGTIPAAMWQEPFPPLSGRNHCSRYMSGTIPAAIWKEKSILALNVAFFMLKNIF